MSMQKKILLIQKIHLSFVWIVTSPFTFCSSFTVSTRLDFFKVKRVVNHRGGVVRRFCKVQEGQFGSSEMQQRPLLADTEIITGSHNAQKINEKSFKEQLKYDYFRMVNVSLPSTLRANLRRHSMRRRLTCMTISGLTRVTFYYRST